MHTYARTYTHVLTHKVLVEPGFGKDVRLQPPPSPPMPTKKPGFNCSEPLLAPQIRSRSESEILTDGGKL